MEYRVLGHLEVSRNGEAVDLGSHRQKTLLAVLLANANSIVSTDRLIDEIWGDDASTDKQNSLWVYVSNLRKVLDPDREKRSEGTILLTKAPGYLLQIDEEEIDANTFERMVTEGRALLETDPDAASLVLGEGLALWRGKAFEDFVYESFAQAEIARLEELRLEAVELRIDANLKRGMGRELISELEGLVRQHPTRERLTGLLMVALYRSGRQAEALRAYQLLRGRLADDLGIEPSGQLQRLEEQMVMNDPALLDATTSLAAAGPEPGMAIRGYELRERIGEGGFGVVYRAYQPAIGREVAIKVIRPELADNPAFIRRFEEEAQLVARLEHPHIIPLYDYWREPGAAYLVMRYMKAGSLRDALEHGPLDADEVRTLVEHIGSALETAHRNGIVHRDVKPANILRDEAGNAYLSDFGIATGAGTTTPRYDQLPLTLAAPYASPEQLESGTVTPASDVYSFAVVLAHALVGRDAEPEELEVGMSPAAAAVIGDATAPERGLRYPDASAFTAAMLEALGAEQVEAPEFLVNPYKGLRAFGQADAEDFFGREQFVERLVTRLGDPDRGRFVAVVGPSGSGKSSAVRAGVLPALRAGAAPGSAGWFQIEMTPGRYPFEELEAALLGIAVNPPATLLEQLKGDHGIRRAVRRVLAAEDARLLIVVDQFEELFTHSDPVTASRFMSSLAEAVEDDGGTIKVVATLRADFYDRPLQHRVFGELLRDGTEIVTPMSPEELERAISGPAEKVGVSIEPALVAQMITDVADRPAALPLLQYALTEIFDQRVGMTVPSRAYEQLGGVSGALAERAEYLYGELTPAQRGAARSVFLRLVTVGEGGGDDTRRRALLSELSGRSQAGSDAQAVIDTFGRHRLLAFDRDPLTRSPTVEISHEALLREWKRFGRWIDDARDDLRARRRLDVAADEWHDRDQDPDFVFTGAQFAHFQGWLENPPVHLTAREADFLRASAVRQAELDTRQAEEALRESQLKTRSRLLIGMSLVAVLFIGLAAYAFTLRRTAQQAQADIRAFQQSLVLASESLAVLADDPDLALMLALEAGRDTAGAGFIAPEVLDTLHWALQQKGVQYPADDTTAIAVRNGPLGLGRPPGPRGVFMVAPAELLELAQDAVTRPFTEDECSRYFAGEACPDLGGSIPGGVTVLGGDEAYGSVPQSLDALAATTVFVRDSFSEADSRPFRESLEAVSRATDIELRNFLYRDPFLAAEGRDGPADILVLEWTNPARDLIDRGLVIDLTAYLDPVGLRDAFGSHAISLMTVGADGSYPAAAGAVHGFPIRTDLKSLFWYAAEEFDAAGYLIPRTWEGTMSLADLIAADGAEPFCLGFEDGPFTGWLPADWVESIVLRSQGPDFYDRWVAHEVPFDHPAVVDAIAKVGQMAHSGGQPGAAFDAAQLPYVRALDRLTTPIDGPPGCWLSPMPSFALRQTTLFQLESGVDYDVFEFPVFNIDHAKAAVGSSTFVMATTDSPEVRAVMRALTDPRWGEAWARSPGATWLPSHQEFDRGAYRDDVRRSMAELTLSAIASDTYRIDGSDRMPPAVGSITEAGPGAFWSEMTRLFVEGTAENYRELATEIAANIEAAWVAWEAAESG